MLKSQDAIVLGDGYNATVSHWEQTYTRDDGTKAAAHVRKTEGEAEWDYQLAIVFLRRRIQKVHSSHRCWLSSSAGA